MILYIARKGSDPIERPVQTLQGRFLMNTSKFLSKVIGLYELFISLSILFDLQHFTNDIQDLMHNSGLMLFIGCMTVIMGILLVVSHNIWQWRWTLLVTIVSWLVLIKGLTLLFFPHSMDQITYYFVTNMHFAYSIAVFDLILGLMFCYFGFRRE